MIGATKAQWDDMIDNKTWTAPACVGCGWTSVLSLEGSNLVASRARTNNTSIVRCISCSLSQFGQPHVHIALTKHRIIDNGNLIPFTISREGFNIKFGSYWYSCNYLTTKFQPTIFVFAQSFPVHILASSRTYIPGLRIRS